MKKLFSKEVVIGLAVVLSLAILFVGIDYLKGINVFKPANFYYVKYNNVTGLAVSSPVTINGFQVGLVREINYEYNSNGSMIVEISLDKELKIPVGTKALLSADILGTANIQLALVENKDYYEVGAELVGENTKGMMEDINNKVMPTVVDLLPKIDSLLINLNKVVSNPALNNSLTRLDNITQNIEKSTVQLNSIMSTSLPVIIKNVDGISTNLNSITNDLGQVTTVIKNMPLDSTMNNVYHTTENLRILTDGLTKNNSTIGLLLNDRKLYDHLNGTVSNLDSILIDLKKNPKRYVNFKLF